jgi:hypothetical protein
MIGEILPQHFANDTRTEQLSNENTHMKSGSAGRAPRGHQGTATIRVPSVLRNRLKVIAAREHVRLCELTENILGNYMSAFERSIGRSLDDFSELPDTARKVDLG